MQACSLETGWLYVICPAQHAEQQQTQGCTDDGGRYGGIPQHPSRTTLPPSRTIQEGCSFESYEYSYSYDERAHRYPYHCTSTLYWDGIFRIRTRTIKGYRRTLLAPARKVHNPHVGTAFKRYAGERERGERGFRANRSNDTSTVPYYAVGLSRVRTVQAHKQSVDRHKRHHHGCELQVVWRSFGQTWIVDIWVSIFIFSVLSSTGLAVGDARRRTSGQRTVEFGRSGRTNSPRTRELRDACASRSWCVCELLLRAGQQEVWFLHYGFLCNIHALLPRRHVDNQCSRRF